jgi:hypothetical protein
MPDTVLYNNGLASIPAAQIQVTPAGGASGSISSFLNGGTALPSGTVSNAITCSTTQTLAGALALTAAVNVISTVGTAGDAVKLAPALNVGQVQVVINNGASACSIFPFETATAIDSHSTAAAATLTNAHRALFYQNTASTWVSFASVSAAS